MLSRDETPSGRTIASALGAAFVFVFGASLLSGVLRSSADGSAVLADGGSMTDVLASIAENLSLMRLSILLDLANTVGIIVLAVLLYIVLRRQNAVLALVAFGWWLAEAVVLAVSRIGAFALIPLSTEYATAGASQAATFEVLGHILYHGIDRTGFDIHMLFFCLGAVIWYALMYRSGIVPRLISLWGLGAVLLVTVGSMIALYDSTIAVPIALYVAYIPFELLICLWLIMKGFTEED
ncbi:MAG: DUF4386 domain-containing protein, partial [Anaerolineae bacterium]